MDQCPILFVSIFSIFISGSCVSTEVTVRCAIDPRAGDRCCGPLTHRLADIVEISMVNNNEKI